jgi:hypothetical protein
MQPSHNAAADSGHSLRPNAIACTRAGVPYGPGIRSGKENCHETRQIYDSFTAARQQHAACGLLAPACTKVIDNGSDANKKVLVVLGDGYPRGDQTKYNEDVKILITDGVFGHNFYLENQNAFNVYRINLVSVDSGVSQKVYNENGPPTDASEVRGDFVCTAAFGNDMLSVQAIPDPFEMRAFPPPQDTAMQTGHHFQQADTARIVLTLPNASAVQQRMDQLQLNFYKWTPKMHVHDIDVEQFQRALKGKELKKVVDIPAKDLSPQLRANLKALQ